MRNEQPFRGARDCQSRVWGHLLSVVCAALGVAAAGGREAGAAEADAIQTRNGPLIVHPINHATFALEWDGKTIYNDPVGGAKAFAGLRPPDLILITDIHGDHMDAGTLEAVAGPGTKLVAPAAVAERLPAGLRERTVVVANGKSADVLGMRIDGVAAYNLTPERLKYHDKGRGNGYVLTLGGKRIYISGDTEDVPEMLGLKDIDVAFVCMNLPYTMTVEQAARAVRTFKPKIVYPYHYRGSDVQKFKNLVGTDAGVEVRLRDWYGR